MSKQIQFRRGTASEHTTFTGAIGEITMDTTAKTLRVHDGAKPGGYPLVIQTDIANKVDTNMVNITKAGKSAIASMNIPSTKFIEITPPAIGTEGVYAAPANGFMVMSCNVPHNVCYYILNSNAGYLGTCQFGTGTGTLRHRTWCPIGKNQVAKFNLEGGSYEYIRFYYAQGEI